MRLRLGAVMIAPSAEAPDPVLDAGHIRTMGRLPVRAHLRPAPVRRSLPVVPGEEVVLIERVDRVTHCQGWGYDWAGYVPLEIGQAMPVWGEA